RSNVRITGTTRSDSKNGRVLDVTDVKKLDDDVVYFRKRVAALARDDADGRFKAANDALARADAFSTKDVTVDLADVRDWARSANAEGLEIRAKALVKTNAAGAIDLARKFRDLAGNTNRA